MSVFPITAGEKKGHVVLLHDLNFVDARAREARLYLTLALIGVAVGLSLLATAVVLGLLRGWRRSIKAQIEDFGLPSAVPRGDDSGFDREIQSLLSELNVERRYAEGIKVEWSPATLRTVLEEELPGDQVLVVSNREPYIHKRKNGEIELQIPASGLVTAVEPVMRACSGTWIAHGSGTADSETVDANDRIAVPPADPAYTLRRVWLSEEEEEGYYYGFANEGLWPLCHIAHMRPMFRASDWEQYVAVNERFADAVVRRRRDDPIVLVQDYHFALLPRMMRDGCRRRPSSRSGTFPGRTPRRSASARGARRSSTACSAARSSASTRSSTATTSSRRSTASWRAASIASAPRSPRRHGDPDPSLSDLDRMAACGARLAGSGRAMPPAVRERFSLPPDAILLVGVDRLDYTKGILERFHAVDDLLARDPSWMGGSCSCRSPRRRAPARRYSELQEEGMRLAATSTSAWTGDYARSSSWSATTRPTRSMSCFARPTSAS